MLGLQTDKVVILMKLILNWSKQSTNRDTLRRKPRVALEGKGLRTREEGLLLTSPKR